MKPGLPNPPEATLTCVTAGETISHLVGHQWKIHSGDTLGHSGGKVTYVLPDLYIAGIHCGFTWKTDQWFIEDKEPLNGTYLQGEKLPRGGISPIANGAEIRIGLETFKFTY